MSLPQLQLVIALILLAVALPVCAEDKEQQYANRAIAYDLLLQAAVQDAKAYRQETRLGYIGYNKTIGSQAETDREDKADEASGDYDRELKRTNENIRIAEVAKQHFNRADAYRREERKFLRDARRLWGEMRADPSFSSHYKLLTNTFFPKALVDKTNKDFRPEELCGITGRGTG